MWMNLELGHSKGQVFWERSKGRADRGVCSGPPAFPEILVPQSWQIRGALNTSEKIFQKGAVKFVSGEAAKTRAGVWKCWILVT